MWRCLLEVVKWMLDLKTNIGSVFNVLRYLRAIIYSIIFAVFVHKFLDLAELLQPVW